VIHISEIDVSNPEGYGKEFAPKAQELSRKHGGRPLALGGIGGGPTQTHPITGLQAAGSALPSRDGKALIS